MARVRGGGRGGGGGLGGRAAVEGGVPGAARLPRLRVKRRPVPPLPGMPPPTNTYDEGLATSAYALATRWHTADVMGIGAQAPKGAAPADLEGWSSTQKVAFLSRLSDLRSLTPLHPTITRKASGRVGGRRCPGGVARAGQAGRSCAC